MEQFENDYCTFNSGTTATEVIKKLNEYGKAGWEVSGTLKNNNNQIMFFFKRKKIINGKKKING